MTVREIVTQLATLDEVRSEGYRGFEDLFAHLSVVVGRDYPGDVQPGQMYIHGIGIQPLTSDVTLSSEFIVAESTPHVPQIFLYILDDLAQVEAHVLRGGGVLNRFTGLCIVLLRGAVIPYEVYYRYADGRDVLFHKADQQGFGDEYPNARLVWWGSHPDPEAGSASQV